MRPAEIRDRSREFTGIAVFVLVGVPLALVCIAFVAGYLTGVLQ